MDTRVTFDATALVYYPNMAIKCYSLRICQLMADNDIHVTKIGALTGGTFRMLKESEQKDHVAWKRID